MIKSSILILLFVVSGLIKTPAQTIMNIHQDNGTVLQIPLNTIDSITYTITAPGNLATVTTLPITNINSTSAVAEGNISTNGGTPVTQRGFCWNTNQGPSLVDDFSDEGSGVGDFSNMIGGLSPSTMYYLRAYAINSAGVAYGNVVTFTTTSGGSGNISNPGPGVVFNGYNYPSVILGNGQEWMAENLRTTAYSNGDPIPNVPDGSQWADLSSGAWVHYDNNNQFEDPYGKLYNWFAVNDSRNVCPIGWHVPSNDEWIVLEEYLGGQNLAGGKLKSMGTTHWDAPNAGATNESGFSGLPGGFRGPSSEFYNFGQNGKWWSSTESTIFYAYSYFLTHFDGNLHNNSLDAKEFGASMRCLKD